MIADALFPSACAGCGAFLRGGAVLCPACRDDIPLRETLLCGRCGARLPDGRRICHRDRPYLLAAAADYRHPTVRALVHALKFRSARAAADALGDMMVRHLLRAAPPLPGTVVVPVPLGARRERERGFNQAALLAKIIAARFGLSVPSRALARTRETAEQNKLRGIAARRANVDGSFAAQRPAIFAGQDVLLVDDVCTSGSTLSASARALKVAGARRIIAVVAARA